MLKQFGIDKIHNFHVLLKDPNYPKLHHSQKSETLIPIYTTQLKNEN